MSKRIARLALVPILSIALLPATSLVAQDDDFDDMVGTNEMFDADDDIGMTVEELEGLISLPPTAQLMREADEDPESPRAIFGDEARRRAFLGAAPDFVYIPAGVDPMIIPWIREQIVVSERVQDAQRIFNTARNARDKDQARQAQRILEELREEFPEATDTPDINRLYETVVLFIETDDQPGIQVTGPPRERAPELPPWVINNTRGIIYDLEQPDNSLALVGDFIISPGGEVDSFPAVRILEIRPEQVIFEYQETQFVIPVQAY